MLLVCHFKYHWTVSDCHWTVSYSWWTVSSCHRTVQLSFELSQDCVKLVTGLSFELSQDCVELVTGLSFELSQDCVKLVTGLSFELSLGCVRLSLIPDVIFRALYLTLLSELSFFTSLLCEITVSRFVFRASVPYFAFWIVILYFFALWGNCISLCFQSFCTLLCFLNCHSLLLCFVR